MTPAAFDTRRRALGLSVEETAALCGVQERVARRWISGALPLKSDVPQILDTLEESMERAVEEALAIATHLVDRGPVTLWRYRSLADLAHSAHASAMPLGAHAITVAWIADALATEGVDSVIEWAAET